MIRRKGVSFSSQDATFPWLLSFLPLPTPSLFPLATGTHFMLFTLFCLARVLYRWNHAGCVQFGWVPRFLSFFTQQTYFVIDRCCKYQYEINLVPFLSHIFSCKGKSVLLVTICVLLVIWMLFSFSYYKWACSEQLTFWTLTFSCVC